MNDEPKTDAPDLSKIDSRHLLAELWRRGGHPGALAEAAMLCIRKSEDYNHGQTTDPHKVDRSAYFPLGTASYAQMIHTKSERFVSLTKKELDGVDRPNYEGLVDTALDLINYAGFYVDAQRRRTSAEKALSQVERNALCQSALNTVQLRGGRQGD